MPPRQPTKNRINMHDIVAQPLAVLPDAVDAILRRPEALDSAEVNSIFHQSSFIFLRAEEALSARDGDALCALMKLLSEGFASSEASFEEGIKAFVLQEPLLQTVHSLFRAVVEQGALPMHSPGTVELVQVVSSLCDGEALKDTCGSLFMKELAEFLERVYSDAQEAQKHFHVQRAVATALINLVKGSKQNKLRLHSWKFIADCCAVSVDVFFQLQCVELLFRVSRQKRTLLTELGESLSAATLEELRGLPNDGALLRRMTGLIQSMNAGRAEVLHFTLTQVTAADTVLTESTDVFFTPHYFIVMVTSSNADNITIPYRVIRSVTLGKDGRVIIRLEEFPVKLEVLLSHTAGMDLVTLHMATDQLAVFKQSPIRSWIVAAITARREAVKAAAGAGGSPHDGSAAAASPAGNEEEPAPEAARGAPKVSVSVNMLAVSSSSDSAAGDSRTALADEDTPRKKQRLELARETGIKTEKDTHGANSTTTTVLRTMIDAIGERSNAKETHAIYAQLKRLIDARTELHLGEGVVALNKIMGCLQASVDAARRTAEQHRVAWRNGAGAGADELDAQITAAQSAATAAVEKLNEDLLGIKQNNQALRERLACIEVDVQRSLEESRGVEESQLRDLRDRFGHLIDSEEKDLDQRMLDRSNSAVVLSDYLQSAALRGTLL